MKVSNKFNSKEIKKIILKKFRTKNIQSIQKFKKVSLNMRINNINQTNKIIDSFKAELKLITGQEAYTSYSKESISNFKLKENMPVSVFTNLRNQKMERLLERLIHITIPRINDFQGFARKKFDKHKNYNFGVSNKTIFPEISVEKTLKIQGLDISISFKLNKKEETQYILEKINFPFNNK